MSRKTKLAALAAASTAAVALTATPAFATTWTTGSFSASGGTGNVVVHVPGLGDVTCTSTLSGTIAATSPPSANATFSVTSPTATGCPVPVSTRNTPWAGSINGTTASMYFSMRALLCTYSGTLSGAGSWSDPTATFTNQPVTGSGIGCVSGVTVDATYTFSQP